MRSARDDVASDRCDCNNLGAESTASHDSVAFLLRRQVRPQAERRSKLENPQAVIYRRGCNEAEKSDYTNYNATEPDQPMDTTENITTDQDAEVRKLADDLVDLHWKIFLSAAGRGDEDGARKAILSFDQSCEENKAKVIRGEYGPDVNPENFRKMVQYTEEARGRIADEYDRSPTSLKLRLGVPVNTHVSVPARQSNRMGIGEMAVRTAVRATVWTVVRDAIRAILR